MNPPVVVQPVVLETERTPRDPERHSTATAPWTLAGQITIDHQALPTPWQAMNDHGLRNLPGASSSLFVQDRRSDKLAHDVRGPRWRAARHPTPGRGAS